VNVSDNLEEEDRK